MTAEDRWQHVERLYHDALARPAGERAQFVRDACAGDEALQREVESLLTYASDAQQFMDTPAIAVAAAAFVPPEAEDGSMLAAGTQLGPYTIVAPLGAGGMGEVYRAHDARLGRDVAVKMLPRRVTEDRVAVERFTREARAASALNHPNIVTIHEIGETDAGRFIVMELVQGRTLRAMVRARIPIDVFAHAATQMTKALAAAHAAGIVHRDIKPENVMVRDDGYVKLLDFGLARLIPAASTLSKEETAVKTVAGAQIGTARYMSPEQARGDAITAATDIFSLGIVFYELTTGQRPFTADSEIGVLHAILADAPQPASRLNPEIPASLDALILQMLQKDARLRPSATEVDAALTAAIAAARPGWESGRVAVDTKRHTVGRTEERRELRGALDAAAGGHGLLVCVTGEPGIGKTTLVEDFLDDLAGHPYRIARGRCSERLAGTEAYLPWLEALETLLRGEGGDSVARVMKVVAPTWYLWVAPIASADASSAHLTTAAPPVSQERMKRELSALVEEISRLRPLLLFFDDVHWADVSTIDLLAYLATKFEVLRILIVATYRPSELTLSQHPFLHVKRDLSARGVCREMPLAFLTTDDIERYLALEFPQHRLPADLAAFVQAQTEGNPLFMADLVRHLRDSRVINNDGGTWVLAQSVPDLQRQIPESVRSMIQTKIAQLAEADRRLLACGSVQGYEFDSAIVAKALALDAADVEERLEALDRVHAFVRLVSEHEFPDRTLTLRYQFVHVLYQNALFGSLQPTRRATWSAAVADALIGYYGKQRSAIASELAMLLETARDFARAAEYFLIAAQQAAHVAANKEAVVLARRGLHAIKSLPETSERAERELLLQTTLGPALMGTVGWGSAEVQATYTRARALCQQVGGKLFSVIQGLCQFYIARADYQVSCELGEQLLVSAQKMEEPGFLLHGHNSLANTFWLRGEWELARTHATQAISIYDPSRHHSPDFFYSGHDAGVMCRSFAGVSLWSLGYPDQAVQRSQQSITLARELSHSYSLVLALVFEAMVQQRRRDATRTREHAEAAMELAAQQELPVWLAWAMQLRGWAICEQAHAEEGIAELCQGYADCRAAGLSALRPYFLALLVDAYARNGQIGEGLTTITEALAITEQTDERHVEAELYRLKGELLLDPAEAESCFHRAIEISRNQNAKSFELRAVMSLCRLHDRHGRRTDARQMLAEIYGWFTEGFGTSDLKDAAVLLERI